MMCTVYNVRLECDLETKLYQLIIRDVVTDCCVMPARSVRIAPSLNRYLLINAAVISSRASVSKIADQPLPSLERVE